MMSLDKRIIQEEVTPMAYLTPRKMHPARIILRYRILTMPILLVIRILEIIKIKKFVVVWRNWDIIRTGIPIMIGQQM